MGKENLKASSFKSRCKPKKKLVQLIFKHCRKPRQRNASIFLNSEIIGQLCYCNVMQIQRLDLMGC